MASSATRSVRVRIALAATAVVALAVAGVGWLLVRAVEDRLQDAVADAGRERLRAVARQLADGVAPGAVHVPGPGDVTVQVLAPDGDVLGPLGAAAPPITVIPADEAGDLADPSGGTRIIIPRGSAGRAAELPVDVRYQRVEGPAGRFTVVAASPLDDVRRSVDALKGALTVAYPLLVAAVGALAWFVVGRALRPVEAMRTEVERITATTIHRRVPEPGTGDEVDRLARTMNAMLDRLEHASADQRRFVSDASHELRSPLASIRTALEVARAHPERADWTRVADDVLAEEARLETIVGDLLLLAREDEAVDGPSTEVDVATVVREEAARPRRLAIAVDTPASGAVVRGDRRALASAVGHLLDNATRHANTSVRCSVEVVGDRVVVRVDDDGHGIPTPDRARVFERFVRLDEGRTRDRGGAGLGLAVVRATAQRHGGAASIASSPTGGARVEVTLPAAAAK